MRHLFIIDPLERLNFSGDTSLELMRCATLLGHEVAYAHAWDLSLNLGKPTAFCRKVRVGGELGAPQVEHLGSETWTGRKDAVVWLRVDPPVDQAYLFMLYWAGLLPSAVRVVNRPGAVSANNEKLMATRFSRFMPQTLISANISEILEFVDARPEKQAVVKPVDGYAGKGVLLVKSGNPTNKSLLEMMTSNGRTQVVAQDFLPEVTEGDARVLLAGGDYLGAVLRVPPKGDIRSNLAVGGSPQKALLGAKAKGVVKALKPFLVENGLFFVGIDLIGPYLTEINFTSPTGLVSASLLSKDLLGLKVFTKL